MDNRNYCLYRHTNTVNGKCYIGITSIEPEKRWGKDGRNYKECPYFWCAIQKYGWDAFKHEVLLTGLTREEASDFEIYMIKELDLRNHEKGYNLSVGGTSCPGEFNPFYGKTHTAETREKISQSNKRRIWTNEAKQKLKQKLSGVNSPCRKPVRCIETNKEYETCSMAAAEMNVTPGKICDVLKGRHKTCAGFHWEYVTSESLTTIPEGSRAKRLEMAEHSMSV